MVQVLMIISQGGCISTRRICRSVNGLILKDDTTGRIAAYRFHIPDRCLLKKSIQYLPLNMVTGTGHCGLQQHGLLVPTGAAFCIFPDTQSRAADPIADGYAKQNY